MCAVTRDEERFGLEYDLDLYNIVAVSDFNMGGKRNSLPPCLNMAYDPHISSLGLGKSEQILPSLFIQALFCNSL